MPTLYLIPTHVNPEINAPALLNEQLNQIQHLQHFVVETAKIGRNHIKQLNLNTALQQLNIQELNKHQQDYLNLITPLQNGFDLGLLSDCGCPAIADPGSKLVALAHTHGFNIAPLVGPSSITLALMASGLNGQNFHFHGYLAQDIHDLKKSLTLMEQQSKQQQTTHIFIEAPFRNQKLLTNLLNYTNPQLKLCLAINLMTPNQQIITQNITKWKNQNIDLHKQEVLFLLGMT